MNSIYKKSFLLILTMALILSVHAQKKGEPVYVKPDLPMDETTKVITYSKVVEVAGVPDTLYAKCLRWFNTYYNNPTDVIKEKDPVAGKITGKSRLKILNPPDKNGVQTMKGIVIYTLTTEFKEGRFKYTVNDINLKATSHYPCENWLNTEAQDYTTVNNFFLTQVHEQITEALKSLEAAMTKAPDQKAKDW
jgi:hypothetical protein